ncbi:YtxH domain-containing protein [Alkalicoccus daliensis]|uniref:Gas vesicle protein n=1 Tax=Alkalicoccus daliensis TaxID=745820 RepID=A0A1H0L100_9BACI|nr:YtxH domain-containing protein [Alkalicoccus daliensis]SDO61712.1 hypothetical protein SAMN04488053_12213 [Alkalicoccus daliensis]
MDNQNQGQGSAGKKLLTGMAAGALIGVAAVMLDSNARRKVIDTTTEMKDSTMRMAGEVRNDPQGTKDQIMERVESAADILKNTVGDLQNLYDKANNEVFDQAKEVKEDVEKTLSSAKNIGEELKEVGSQVGEAKEELTSEGSDSSESTGQDNSRPIQ